MAAFALAWAGLTLSKGPDWVVVAVLVLLGITGASLRERDLEDHLGLSFATVVLAAALPLVGAGGAVLVGWLSYLADVRRQRLRARLFNAAMTGCMGGVGGLVYVWTGGKRSGAGDLSDGALLMDLALPLTLGYVVMAVLNALLIGLMMRLVQGGSTVAGTVQTLHSMGPGYLLHVMLGLLLVILWKPANIGIFSAVLMLGPLLLAQWTLTRDAEERRAHLRTVKTLMGALEVANPYSVGHSARVGALCRRMAPDLGIIGEEAEVLYYAALLHDLGLVATGPRLPRGSGRIDLTYLAAVVEHPEVGSRMVQDIDFLAPALPGILHHHERWDGRGYPAGLSGQDIPLPARVIAVADAFDSLTTTRSYRAALNQDQALQELRDRAGGHLDPGVVMALETSLQRQPWEATVIEDEVLGRTGDVYDHDDPEVSDQYAAWQPEVEGARS